MNTLADIFALANSFKVDLICQLYHSKWLDAKFTFTLEYKNDQGDQFKVQREGADATAAANLAWDALTDAARFGFKMQVPALEHKPESVNDEIPF